MNDEDLPDEGPVTDPKELERVMMLTLKDPGRMRVLPSLSSLKSPRIF